MRNTKTWILSVVMLSSLIAVIPAIAGVAKHTTEIDDGVYTFGDPAKDYYSMFVVTDEGVIVVEPVNTGHSKALFNAIKSVTKKPIKYLLHSHNHWDHSGGGQIFRDAGATIVAHYDAYEWMKANPRQDVALPDEGWKGKRKDIILGGTTIELHYLGMNHGLGMTVFRLPKEKIVFIADIVTPERVLFSIVPDFNITQWVRSLKEIEALDFKTAVFTHGKPTGTKKDVTANREFIEDLKGAIYAEFKKGTNPMMIPSVVQLPKYEHWAMYEQWLPLNAWRVLLDGHMGPFPWHAEHDH